MAGKDPVWGLESWVKEGTCQIWMQHGGGTGNRLTLVPRLRASVVTGFTHFSQTLTCMVDINLSTFAHGLSPSAHSAIDHDLFTAQASHQKKWGRMQAAGSCRSHTVYTCTYPVCPHVQHLEGLHGFQCGSVGTLKEAGDMVFLITVTRSLECSSRRLPEQQ